MSILIDDLMGFCQTNSQFGSCWYVSKPYEGFYLKQRLVDAWRVLTGKSRAYHYKEDEDSEE